MAQKKKKEGGREGRREREREKEREQQKQKVEGCRRSQDVAHPAASKAKYQTVLFRERSTGWRLGLPVSRVGWS